MGVGCRAFSYPRRRRGKPEAAYGFDMRAPLVATGVILVALTGCGGGRDQGGRLVVRAPGIGADAAAPLARQLAARSPLRFYDWEASVVGPRCRIAPSDTQVNGGEQAGSPAFGLSRDDAIRRTAAAGGDPQHVAVVLDERLLSTPSVAYHDFPDGIDASFGSQIDGGLTRAAARAVASAITTGTLTAPLALDGLRVVG
jgi:hypothetical protein